MNIAYIHSGRFTSRGEWIHPERVIDSYELIIVTEGCFELFEDGKLYTLSPGKGILLEPGKLHRGVLQRCERVSFYWIHFHAFDDIGVKFFTLREEYPVILLCRQLLSYAKRGFSSDITGSLLYVLLAEIESQNKSGESESTLVSKICEWIRINSDRKLSVATVAENFGYSEDYISRLLKKHIGQGLKTLINEYKMKYLKRQLIETEITLTELSDYAGFSDYKLFLKFFKYHEGVTPTEFRSIYSSVHTNNR
jgi:AraC-like DNA-binding protein